MRTSLLRSRVLGRFVAEVKTPAQDIPDLRTVDSVSRLRQVRRSPHWGGGLRSTKGGVLDLLSQCGPCVGSATHTCACLRIAGRLGFAQPLRGLSAAVLYGHHIRNSTKRAHRLIS